MITLQVTIFNKENVYRPISTTLQVEDVQYYKNNKAKVHKDAITKICAKRYTTPQQLAKDGFNQIKVRVYSPEGKSSNAEKVAKLQEIMQQRQKRKELNK